MGAKIGTTQWSQVLAARDGSDTEARRALEELCQTYWPPLYAFFRHLGASPENAADLTQAFLASLLESSFFQEVDPAKGRFRSYLLASARNFYSNEATRERALKRGGGHRPVSLDVDTGEQGYTAQPVETLTPEDVFERRWAMTVLENAMERLRLESGTPEAETQFEHLRQYLTSDTSQAPYREAGEALGLSEGAVATAVHRLRKRFGQCLREEVGQMVADPRDIDDELRHMLTTVRSQASGPS